MRDLNDEKDYSWNNVNSDPSIMDIEYENAYGDLQDYYTSAQTEERISEVLSEVTTSGITRQELQEAISNETARTENTYLKEHQSLADYYTSAQTDSAITSVLSEYYNSGQTNEKIAEAISGITFSGISQTELDTAIANETARTENTYLKEHQSLNDYYTSAQTNSAITETIANETARTENAYAKTEHTHSEYVTSGDVQNQIASGLNAYYTSAQTDTAIQNAVSGIDLSDYYTSAQTESAITDVMTVIESNERVTAFAFNDVNERFTDFYTSAQTDTAIQNAVSGIDLSNYYTSAKTESAITELSASTDIAIANAIADETARTESTYLKEHQSLSGVGASIIYNSDTTKVQLKNSGGQVISEFDASLFIKDGMLSSVTIDNVEISGASVPCLVMVFNTDAGVNNINVPLSLIFKPDNYYTSAQTNSVITSAITDVMSVIEDNEEVTAFAFNDVNKRFSDYYTSAQTESTYAKTGHTHSEYVTSGDVQNQISSGLTDYYTSAQTDTAIQNAVSGIDLSNYYTSAQTESAITDVMSVIESNERVTAFALNDVNERFTDYYTSAQTDTAIQNAVSGIDLGDYYTSAQTDTAIQNAVSGIDLGDYYTSAQTESAITSAITDVISVIEDNEEVTAFAFNDVNKRFSDYYTSAQTNTAIQNAVSGIDLSDYYTSAQTESTYAKTGHTHSEYVTSGDVQNQISSGLTDYYTSAQTNTAIQNAVSGIDLSDYYTSAQTESTYAKTGHTHSEYVTSGDVQSQISSAVTEVSQHCLPQVTSSDNGKTLQIVNGVWTLVDPTTIYSGSGTPNNQEGNNGDIYMQTE